MYDVIIIGAGPIGLACAIEAKKHDLKYLVLEKGCLVNSIFYYPTNMTFFSTSERLEIGEVPFVSHGVKPTRREALEYYRRVVGSYELNVHTYEKVTDINNSSSPFEIITEKGVYNTKNVIISTGFYDYYNKMNVPGEDLSKVKHYYDEPHPYAYKKIAIIGAGNSAVDVALETFRQGAEVTMIIRESEIKPSVKYWVKPDIENRIKEGVIKAYFNSSIIEIKENSIIVQTPGKVIEIENDFVLAMTGYHADFKFLEKFGVEIKDGIPLFNENTFETSRKGIYLAGVVCGGVRTDRWFIENSIEHSRLVIKDISNK